jgi:tRNA(Ile2) C34 agmatinyltransferase TiaS
MPDDLGSIEREFLKRLKQREEREQKEKNPTCPYCGKTKTKSQCDGCGA